MKAYLGFMLAFSLGHAESLNDALAPWGGPDAFTPRYRLALDAYLKAEEAYHNNDYALAVGVLDNFWQQHPPGTSEWGRGINAARVVAEERGANFGTPVAYYALRMLTDIVAWQQRKIEHQAAPIQLTVLLVGNSTGGGEHHTIDPLLAASDSAVIHEALSLFVDYVSAITEDRLRVDVRVVPLPDLDVPVARTLQSLNVAGQDREFRFAVMTHDTADIWSAVPEPIKASTDWWWVLYPSHVPSNAGTTEYITGGMSRGPDGRSPAFVIDDLWLVRTPPHLGHGMITSAERRIHMAQWFQHEFFHHLYGRFPQYRLDQTGHQWFDRSKWPSDFDGLLEPDYYRESLLKRLPLATPEGAAALRYAH